MTTRQKEINEILFRDKWEEKLDWDTKRALRIEYALESGDWPRPGSTLKFVRIPSFGWHVDILENSKKLILDETYKVTEVDLGSSYCYVKLEDFGDLWFSFGCFEIV